jgi:hypothetical protein
MAATPAPTNDRRIVDVRTLAVLFVFSFSLTLLYQGMRGLQAMGGYASTGGPYLVTRPAPGWTWVLYAAIPLLIVSLGAVFALLRRKPGTSLLYLCWPAAFLSPGWNFVEFGMRGSAPDGIDLVAGGLFILLGLVPLIVLALDYRQKKREHRRTGELPPPRMRLLPLLPQLAVAGAAVLFGVLLFRSLGG